jgi:threonine dehydrogenase-like Zn-dependent dehydrogenase
MQALVFKDYRKMTLDDIPPPQPNPDEVIVGVAACGICGSDLEGYMGTPGMRNRRVPPLLLGHEFAGTVLEGPPEWLNRPVAVNPLVSCGDCSQCRSGRPHLCPKRSLIGLNRPGAFGEKVAVPLSQLHALPEDFPLWRGALAEPLAVALHALELAGTLLNRRVIVFGGGTIGFLTAWAVARAGAYVEVVEISEARRQQLASLGFEAVAPTALPPVAAPEGGAEVTFDTVGLGVTRQQALSHLLPGGTAIMVGLHDDDHPFSFYPLLLQERRLQGSYSYSDADFRHAVALAGELPESFAVREPLEVGPASFEELAAGKTHHLKILLEPREQA